MLLKTASSISQASAMCFFMLNSLHILSISHILLTIDKILVAHQAPSSGEACSGEASLKTVRKDHRQYPNTLKHDELELKHLAKTFTSGKEKPKGPTESSQPPSQGQKPGTSRINFIFFPNRTDYHSSIQGNLEKILSLFPSLRTVGGEKVTPRAYNT